MPVLHVGRNVDYGTGKYLHCRFAFFLIPSATCNAYKHLASAFFSLVDVPIVAATRLKSDVEEGYLLRGYGSEVTLAGKILGVCGVRLADRKYHRTSKNGLGILTLDVVVPHLFGEVESCPCLGPTGIESYVGYDLGYLGACYAVLFRCR